MFRNLSHARILASEISNYWTYLLMWHGNFVPYRLLRNTTITVILHDHFINMIQVTLTGCCSWSLLCCFSFRQACPRFALWMCSPMPNCTDVYVIIPINNFHLLTNVNQWNVLCSQQFNQSMHSLFCTVIVSLNCATFMTVIQKPPAAELQNFKKVQGNVTIWDQISSHCHVRLFLKTKCGSVYCSQISWLEY